MPNTHDLDEALEYLLEEEGGFSNHPSDRGGKTMYGVTQSTYNSYRKSHNLPQQTVRNISKDEARSLYNELYWKASGADRLPWPISYLTFDAAVNSGTKRAVQWTQTGLGVKADGQVGPNTIAVARKAVDSGDGRVLYEIVNSRATFLANLVKTNNSQQAFLLGWWRRTLRVLGRSLLAELN